MDLEQTAIARLQTAAELSRKYYQQPLRVCYSGGKDSEVILELCKRAKVPYEAVHNLTTADAPETVYHVRKVFHRLELEGISCKICQPRYKGQPTSIWALIPMKRIPPTRKIRYCCTCFYRKKAKIESLCPKPPRRKRVSGKTFHNKW